MDTVVVFTRKNLGVMFEQGGSGDWKASDESVLKCEFLVATANSHASDSKHPGAIHRSAFMIGRVSGVVDVPDDHPRKIIQFSEYAEIDVPDCWEKGHRNPVRYADLSSLGISLEGLNWQPFPIDRIKKQDTTPELTVDEAKRGIAKKLGIAPECIEITIRA